MVTIKTDKEIEILREGGKRLAFVLQSIASHVASGVSTKTLNDIGEKLIRDGGDIPAFLNYQPRTAERPYPASICISVNDEVVHGIPNEQPKILKDGDIVSIDAGLVHKGLFTDSAITVPVGKVDEKSLELIKITEKALMAGIAVVKAGVTTGDIGYAIQSVAKPYGFGIIEELCGHGVGYSVHEDPDVPNYGVRGKGTRLSEGMVIAIEPMFTLGSKDIVLDKDGYTYRTADGSRSAHVEHTIVVTKNGVEILTKK